ncbi:uncharacterized protein FIBRA_08793 [Fibroporia radiculosa]|uniref:Uncharacterized protein n=1 Tax=Fibroporia radiculosa TaxID=599839 RepID=J4ICJ5_9APHY|nr:uncharacterized protein FIBRA_08793 [Fibroporia radiculosa]CCM06521.1 predicted protein [Fibroporia radiculosa]
MSLTASTRDHPKENHLDHPKVDPTVHPKANPIVHTKPDPIVLPGDGHVDHPQVDRADHFIKDHVDSLKEWLLEHISHSDKIAVRGVSRDANAIPFNVLLFRHVDIGGNVDVHSLKVDVDVHLIVPILGKIELGSVKGNIGDGLTLNVDVHLIASGSVTFKLMHSNQLWADIVLKTKVGNWNQTEHLVDLP